MNLCDLIYAHKFQLAKWWLIIDSEKEIHCFDDKSKCNVYDHFSCEKKREILIDRHYNFFFFKEVDILKELIKVAKTKKHEKKTKIKNYKNKK
jgi:hypothetical protein